MWRQDGGPYLGQSSGTLVLDFQALAPWQINPCAFKPSNLWYVLTAAQADNDMFFKRLPIRFVGHTHYLGQQEVSDKKTLKQESTVTIITDLAFYLLGIQATDKWNISHVGKWLQISALKIINITWFLSVKGKILEC